MSIISVPSIRTKRILIAAMTTEEEGEGGGGCVEMKPQSTRSSNSQTIEYFSNLTKTVF